MKLKQIIISLLDNDLYKFTMMQVVFHRFATAMVEYNFKLRTKGVDLSPFADEIREQIDAVGRLKFTDDELIRLSKLPYFKASFISFLRNFKLNPNEVIIEVNPFRLRIKGSWLSTILWEMPILSIISEVYQTKTNGTKHDGEKILTNKIIESRKYAARYSSESFNLFDHFKFTEFGTRRRFSREWHERVIQILMDKLGPNLIGTSNVHLAFEYGLTPVGTMAHEYLQACQAFVPLIQSQKYALDVWMQEYRGLLGIALTDVISTDAFLRDFDLFFAKLYDGNRHDSGDPYVWTDKMINHYHKLGIDPKTKTLIYSDNLNFYVALELLAKYFGQINIGFGIGTNLTNDVGFMPLSMVIKMVMCNGVPVAKLSDDGGKTMCEDEVFISHLKKIFHYA